MPRTWFSWTDSVLLGSNKLFIVSETTVPGLRHAKQLVAAIKERLGDGPKPQVIVNRFQQKMFSSGLRLADLEQVLGDRFAAAIPNDYASGARGDRPRRAARRGQAAATRSPQQMKKLVLPNAPTSRRRRRPFRCSSKLKLSPAR